VNLGAKLRIFYEKFAIFMILVYFCGKNKSKDDDNQTKMGIFSRRSNAGNQLQAA
jgi:hypothetical protein